MRRCAVAGWFALILTASACAGRFPDIYYSATAVRVRDVHWIGPTRLVVQYQAPASRHFHCPGAQVRETPTRIELLFIQRHGKGGGLRLQRVEIDNPQRLPVVVSDDVQEVVIWRAPAQR